MMDTTDSQGRRIDYLRISITDRCNERCLYCMPHGYKGWSAGSSLLTADEIVRVVEASTQIGFRKFRLTGGEPLTRPDIVEIARRIWDVPGVQTLGLSTNGQKLAPLVRELRQTGVRSINISLDALDPDVYHRITGGRLEKVLEGIHAAVAAGFERVKLNCVLMRGVNEDQIRPLLRFATEFQLPFCFIELMPLGGNHAITEKHFLSVREVMRWLEEEDRLIPAPETRIGHGPAKYYRLEKQGAIVGFIGALTQERFCETCNKIRLTADGKLRPCLGRQGEVDMLAALRHGHGDPVSVLQDAVRNKPDMHEFDACSAQARPMTAIGG